MKGRSSGEAFLDDIRESCALILNTTKGMTFENFVANVVVQAAVARWLTIVGEASKALPSPTKSSYPSVEWRQMAKLRDLVVHHYWRVDPAEIWSIVEDDLPPLVAALKK